MFFNRHKSNKTETAEAKVPEVDIVDVCMKISTVVLHEKYGFLNRRVEDGKSRELRFSEFIEDFAKEYEQKKNDSEFLKELDDKYRTLISITE